MRQSRTLSHWWALAAFVVALVVTIPAPRAMAAPLGKAPAAQTPATASAPARTSRVIVRAVDRRSLPAVGQLIAHAGGRAGRRLSIINAHAASVPTAALKGLAHNPLIAQISIDRRVAGAMERTGAAVGATAVRHELGYDGSGVGVAVIDSGVTAGHNDLTDAYGEQRLNAFVDFVNGRDDVYDDYGHGTHVAGIIAGNGYDSGGARSGIAPGARLIMLKVLDASGNGRISDVIAALDYVLTHKDDLGIRIVNMSIGAGVYESADTDPLSVATRAVVSAGIVVVAPAGNAGTDPQGLTAYGGITAPGNAPWVLTVGASSHMGTVDPSDDTMAVFSSRGPTAVDTRAKPDVVAPGVGIESLSAPESAFYTSLAAYLLPGTLQTPFMPYLSLSGTSMSAPVVSGTVALMLEANPSLTPNEVKAILQYTARPYPGYDELTAGAGFLNAKGAVELATYLAHPGSTPYPDSSGWGERIIWGNELFPGGTLTADANAWQPGVTWGDGTAPDGSDIAWGEACSYTWRTGVDNVCTPWGPSSNAQNVVWGSTCGGADCAGPWSPTTGATLSTSGESATTVVWGSSDGDTVVWGSTCNSGFCQPVIWRKP